MKRMRGSVFWLSAGLFLTLVMTGAILPVGQAQDDSEEYYSNEAIDCSTSLDFQQDTYISAAFRASGGHNGMTNQNCNACHGGGPNSRPMMGSGKPPTEVGSALIHNRLDEPMSYSVKFGRLGEWKTYEVAAQKVRSHYFKYSSGVYRKSPQVLVRYMPKGNDKAVDPLGASWQRISLNSNATWMKEDTRILKLVATPNQKLGSVYFFDRNVNGVADAKLWQSPREVYGRRRR